MNGVNTYVKNRISLIYQHIYHIYRYDIWSSTCSTWILQWIHKYGYRKRNQTIFSCSTSEKFTKEVESKFTAPWDQGSQQQEYQAKSYGAPAHRATGVACRQDKSSSSRHRHLSAVQPNWVYFELKKGLSQENTSIGNGSKR